MVADANTPKPIPTLNSNHQDSTLPNGQVVTIEADNATKIVADNITAITSIAKNLSTILTQLRTFNDKYNGLLTELNYDGGTKTGIQVLESSLDLKNYLTQISDIASNLTNILKVADLDSQIRQLSLLETDIKDIVNNLADIQKTAALTDYVANVSAISDDIIRIREIEDIIIALTNHIEQLNTIYNYLPQLLKLTQFVTQYLELQQNLGFSDDEYFNILNTISDNLTNILKVAGEIDTMVDISKRLDEFPDIIKNIDDELKDLAVRYQRELENGAKNLTDEFNKAVIDTRVRFQELIERQANYVEECRQISMSLNQLQSDIKIAELDLQKLKIEIQSDAKTTLQELKNDFLKLEMDYTNRIEKLITENNATLSTKSNEFFIKVQTLENEHKQQMNDIQRDLVSAFDRIDKATTQYEDFKSQVELMIKAEIGRMLQVDLTPYLNQNKFSKGEIINLIMQYAPATKTLTETEIKTLIKDTIATQNLTKEEVIQWLNRLNEYRDEKLVIENFDDLFKRIP